MITSTPIEGGKFVYVCDVCQWTRTYPFGDLANPKCDCGRRPAPRPVATRESPKPPGLARKAFNYGKAKATHVAAGRPKCSDEQVAERFAICQSNACGYFIDKGDGLGQCAHQSCGCALKRLSALAEDSKLRWADQRCPAVVPGSDPPQRFWDKVSPAPPVQ